MHVRDQRPERPVGVARRHPRDGRHAGVPRPRARLGAPTARTTGATCRVARATGSRPASPRPTSRRSGATATAGRRSSSTCCAAIRPTTSSPCSPRATRWTTTRAGSATAACPRFPFMCPGTRYWHDFHVERDARLVREHGPDALYYDIAVNNVLLQCYAAGHDHAPGAGDPTRRRVPGDVPRRPTLPCTEAGRHVPVGAEMISELFLPVFDFYQARARSRGRTPRSRPARSATGSSTVAPRRSRCSTYVYGERAPLRMDGWAKLSAGQRRAVLLDRGDGPAQRRPVRGERRVQRAWRRWTTAGGTTRPSTTTPFSRPARADRPGQGGLSRRGGRRPGSAPAEPVPGPDDGARPGRRGGLRSSSTTSPTT